MPNPIFSPPDFGDDASRYAALAHELEAQGDVHGAAKAYDRAFGLAPEDAAIRAARRTLLDRLAVVERGIVFRYIPAGTFRMGSEDGDPDERPVHSVFLDKFWMAETPLSWATFCDLMDCEPPPNGLPREFQNWDYDTAPESEIAKYWRFVSGERIRLQYCEDETIEARDWHAHKPDLIWTSQGKQKTSEEIFGPVPREHPNRPWGYEQKPMVAAGWEMAEECGQSLSTPEVVYGLPTEAQWEKAARGGLVGKRYAWGDALPTSETCDFDHFGQFFIQPSRKFPPNDYGLYAMCGGVWEWLADWYDAEAYTHAPELPAPSLEQGKQRVLRGGSWADCADAVRVAFRMCQGERGSASPNIGFRLCRTVRQKVNS